MNPVDVAGNVLLDVMFFGIILYLVRLISIPVTIIFIIIAFVADRYGKRTLKITSITLGSVAAALYLLLSVFVFQSFI